MRIVTLNGSVQIEGTHYEMRDGVPFFLHCTFRNSKRDPDVVAIWECGDDVSYGDAKERHQSWEVKIHPEYKKELLGPYGLDKWNLPLRIDQDESILVPLGGTDERDV